MRQRHLVDQELLAILDSLPRLKFSLENLPQIRALAAEVGRKQIPASAHPSSSIAFAEKVIPGPKDAPQVRVLVYTPKGRATRRPAYLDIHGGGYVAGSPESIDAPNRALAKQLDCVVVSVDYRLAPETGFPGAVEDCYAALKWLHENAAELGVDPDRIAIGGGSAGGGLAAALALLARDRGEVRVIHQHLICPMIDDRPAADPHPYTGEFWWGQAENRFCWTCLLGREPGGEGVSPYAAAARAENLAGLPSTFITTGALDLFLEEDLEYARRLTRAGVPVELHLYPGAFHGFQMAYDSCLAKMHERDQLEALRRAFRRPRQGCDRDVISPATTDCEEM